MMTDAPSARPLRVLISLRDQSFMATKSMGIYNVSLGLVRGLAQQPNISELHVLVNKDVVNDLKNLPSHVILHGADVPQPRRFRRVWWDQIGVVRAIRMLKPDWAILPKGVIPQFPLVGKTKIACFLHDLNWEYYLQHRGTGECPYPLHELLYFRHLHLHTLKHADRVFTSTQFNRERFLHYVSQAKVSVIGIGFDTPQQPLMQERGRDVLFFASPYRHKLPELGISHLQAWLAQREDGSDIRIHVIGGLPKELPLPDERWVPYGRIPRGGMRELRRKCRVALYCSAYEGFGLPPVECLLAGLPCVASDIPPIRESIPASLLFDNADPDDFIEKMNRAYELTDVPERVSYPEWKTVCGRLAEGISGE